MGNVNYYRDLQSTSTMRLLYSPYMSSHESVFNPIIDLMKEEHINSLITEFKDLRS